MHKRKIAIAIAIVFALTGCADYKLKQAARAAALDGLKDPDSAKFKEIKVVSEDGRRVVCMRVNSKNGFGAYGGYKWALWRPAHDGLPASVMWEGDLGSDLEAGMSKLIKFDLAGNRTKRLLQTCS